MKIPGFGSKREDENENIQKVQLVDKRAWSWPKRLVVGSALLYGGFYAGTAMDFFGSEEKDYGDNVVPVINLHGVIKAGDGGGGILTGVSNTLNIDSLRGQIDKAFGTKGAVAVALDVNSPGGSPVQSELIGDYIQRKAEEYNLPVYSFVQDGAASGGYWIACAADEIYTAKSSTIGSIGVIAGTYGVSELADKLGVESRIYTAGESKSRLDPLEPEKKEDVEWIHTRLNQIHGMFKSWVVECRDGKLNADIDYEKDVFNGSTWFGEDAKELGLTDGIGEMHQVLEDRFGKDVKIVDIKGGSRGLLSIAFGASAEGVIETLGRAIGAGIAETTDTKIRDEAAWSAYRMR